MQRRNKTGPCPLLRTVIQKDVIIQDKYENNIGKH